MNNAFLSVLLAYLLGSIPFGLILTRFSGAGDVRSIGSGSIGATNVLRTGRKDIAALTLTLDALKGAASVLIAWHVFEIREPLLLYFTGISAILGHIFPVWLKFRGGKGVATAFGVLLVLNWQVTLIMVAVWIIMAKIGRISSLSALIAFASGPVVAWFVAPELFSLMLIILFLIIHTHRHNIVRLIQGKESSFKKEG